MAGMPKTLFVGRGGGAVGWYRCALPAMSLGCDWLGVRGEPSALAFKTGMVPDDLDVAGFAGYDVLVLQQVEGPEWARAIRRWRDRGVTVLYEVDDWLHGVRKLGSHAHRRHFTKAEIAGYERCMRAADGIICSTEWLARRYRSVNPRTWTCRNGIDLKRYAFTRPERRHVAAGWAGGTGHAETVRPWVAEVGAAMREQPDLRFVSVGQPFAGWLEPEFGSERCLSIPFTAMEVYPAAMTHFDVSLAPAGKGNYFRGKSDLRWLEASALGIPCIADPDVYPEIDHGVTGFHAPTPAEMGVLLRELVHDPALRRTVGEAAHAHVREHRAFPAAAGAWADAIVQARAGSAAAAA